MFEEKTYENIMAEMMAEMPSDVNTEEGSLIWNACAKQALQLEEAYLALQQVEDNMYTDTQDEEHLIRNGADKGVPIREATNAVLKAEFQQDIETGTRFTANDLNYRVLGQISGYFYEMECEESGTEGNIGSGELSPIDFVEGYEGGIIVGILRPGSDQEDTEEYRKRILSLLDCNYFGGNRADYINFIESLSGVGAVKVKRREEGEEYIYPYILDAEYGVPSEELVSFVQNEVDPEQSHGTGDGIAPIGHKVIIRNAVGVTIDVASVIAYDDGYSQEALNSRMEAAVDGYFTELARAWKETEHLIVRIAQIESRFIQIEGILDIADTRLNGNGNNIVLSYEEIPVRGSINGI